MSDPTERPGDDEAALIEAKAVVRDRMGAIRDAISPEERERKAAVVGGRLAEVLEGRHTVMVFRSFRSEIDTGPIAEALETAGHVLALPSIQRSAEDGPERVAPVAWSPGEPLVARAFGIDEPEELRPIAATELDAVLVPGLAFDREGYRVGYGGGFYDRLLPRLRGDALRVAIGFSEQVVDSVPHADFDVPVDVVVTDAGVLRSARDGD